MSRAPWFGELYLASTADLLTPGLSALEAQVISRLLDLRPGERVLDAGCGHGRHLAALGGRGLVLVGVDRSRETLRLAAATPGLVQADLGALPFGPAFDAAYSWYSSLFLFDEGGNRAALAALAGALRPGGRLLVQHANPLALARQPVARTRRDLPGGGFVEEVARFDPARGCEDLERRLTRQGRVLAGSCRLRYYSPLEWHELARGAGLGAPRLASSGPGGVAVPFGEDSIDLIAVLEKPK